MSFDFRIGKIDEIRSYNIDIVEFENQSEQRRKKTSKKIMGFSIESPALTDAGALAWQAYFDSMEGPFTAFNFTYNGETYSCRFVGGLQTKHDGGVKRITCEFKVLP